MPAASGCCLPDARYRTLRREIGIPEGVGPCQGGGRVGVLVAGGGACVRARVVGVAGSGLAGGHPGGAWPRRRRAARQTRAQALTVSTGLGVWWGLGVAPWSSRSEGGSAARLPRHSLRRSRWRAWCVPATTRRALAAWVPDSVNPLLQRGDGAAGPSAPRQHRLLARQLAHLGQRTRQRYGCK